MVNIFENFHLTKIQLTFCSFLLIFYSNQKFWWKSLYSNPGNRICLNLHVIELEFYHSTTVVDEVDIEVQALCDSRELFLSLYNLGKQNNQ
jgi:hypothetical protein